MKPLWMLLTIVGTATAAQGPAGNGACAQVVGPVGIDGQPLGFTCQDVGGNALLIWNAAQVNSNVDVSGGISTVNYRSGGVTINGSFTSDGPMAFVGGNVTINGSVMATRIVLSGTSSSEDEVKSGLLGASGRMGGQPTAQVTIESDGRVSATNGDIIVGGSSFSNRGSITAANGNVVITVGTKVDIGWHSAIWLAGEANENGIGPHITNRGTITANNVTLEAHRTSISSITNRGTINAGNTITFVTGVPGTVRPVDGTYIPNTLGVGNSGKLIANQVVIDPFYVAHPGELPTPRTFSLKHPGGRTELQLLLGGTIIWQTNNTPASSTSVINTSTAGGTVAPTTANLVIPQLAVSVTHMNSTSAARAPIAVASNNSSEVVRGAVPATSTVSKKPRVKAKPILLRGSFFNSKISAKITASR